MVGKPLIVCLHFDFISRREEGIKPDNELGVTFEKVRDALNDARRVDALRFKLFHDVQEVIVHLRLISEFVFHLKTREFSRQFNVLRDHKKRPLT